MSKVALAQNIVKANRDLNLTFIRLKRRKTKCMRGQVGIQIQAQGKIKMENRKDWEII